VLIADHLAVQHSHSIPACFHHLLLKSAVHVGRLFCANWTANTLSPAFALAAFPSAQITRAAITTSHGGSVYDVFEIIVEPEAEAEGITALDVQFQVHQALHKFGRVGRAAAAANAAASKGSGSDGGASSAGRAASPGTSGSAEGACYDANKRRRSE
jgi:hypothetical protein